MSKYKINDIVNVTITKIQPYGAFVTASDDYKGLIHISEINGKFIDDINKYFYVGKTVKCKILDIDEDKKQLRLSTVNLNKNKLSETELGFSILQKKLPNWIREKEIEIENAKK